MLLCGSLWGRIRDFWMQLQAVCGISALCKRMLGLNTAAAVVNNTVYGLVLIPTYCNDTPVFGRKVAQMQGP